MDVVSTFKNRDRDWILWDRRFGGPDTIMELMMIIEHHLGRYDGEIPSDFDGFSMIRSIAVIWFPAEAIADWEPFFPGMIRDLARGLEMFQPDPLSIDEIVGDVPVSNHGIPTDVINDNLRHHRDCTLYCDLVGKWLARPRHRGAALRFLGILDVILDVAPSFLGLLEIFLGLIVVVEKVLNQLDRTWSQDHPKPMEVPFDQYLIINLVRTSVDLWCNDDDEVKKKPVTTDFVDLKNRIRDTNCKFNYQLSVQILIHIGRDRELTSRQATF